ncbi:MAG: hypothetical protein ABIL45_04400 [candidate division WOR-3 bacterium]
MILNLKIIKEKDNYDIQQFQKYGKNYNSDISFIVILYKRKYTLEALRLCFYYKNEDRIADDLFHSIEFGIKTPFNLNLYIEIKNKGYDRLFEYSIEGNKILFHPFKYSQILRHGFLDYYYDSSKPKLKLFLDDIKPYEKIQKERAIPYFIYKPTLIYSSIAILFTNDILGEVF